MKTLEELKAEANAEEEVEQPEEDLELEQPEEEPEDDQEPEAEEESDELDELELEPDGEEATRHKPDPQEVLLHKLSKKQRKLSKANSELEELRAEIAALKSGQYQQPRPQQPTREAEPQLPPVPVLYEKYKGKSLDTPEQYSRAFQEWYQECEQIRQQSDQRQRATSEYRQQVERKTLDLAKRVSKFATEHKMKDDYVVDAVQRATEEIDKAAGVEGAFAHLLDAVGEGSEKAAIYVGAKDSELDKVKQLLADDKTGLKAVTYLTRIATRKPAQRRISKAPEPDQPLKGDKAPNSAIAQRLKKEYAAAKSIHEMRKVRQKADELGVKLT